MLLLSWVWLNYSIFIQKLGTSSETALALLRTNVEALYFHMVMDVLWLAGYYYTAEIFLV